MTTIGNTQPIWEENKIKTKQENEEVLSENVAAPAFCNGLE